MFIATRLYSAVRQPFALPLRLLLLVGSALLANTSYATVMSFDLDRYYLSVDMPRANYFNGKLLTAADLNQEQSYEREGKRYLPPTDLPLVEVLQPYGFASVVLLLDDAVISPDERSDAQDDHPDADNFIVLDPQTLTWRGRLFVDGFGDVESGVYDDLSGTYRGFQVPMPATSWLLLAGLGVVARRRTFQTSSHGHCRAHSSVTNG